MDVTLLKLPKKLDGYTLVRHINKGGMADIYEGTRDSIQGVTPKVAVKIMDQKKASDKTFLKLFAHEAIVSSNLRHKNLIHVQDYNECEGLHYIVMEYVDGLTLREIIRRCRKQKISLPAPLVAEIGRQICEGLHYAHIAKTPDGKDIGLVHRDIKPSNIMLDKAGVIKIVDFGVSLGDEMKDLKHGFRGTWGYMSIEQGQKKRVTPQSDLFSVGLLLFELCTQRPFFSNQKKELSAVDQNFIDGRLQDLGPDHFVLREVLSKAMSVDLQHRYQSAKEMSEVLDTKSYNMVQARQDLVALYQDILHRGGGGSKIMKTSSGMNSIVGFFIVLLLPMLIILVLYLGNQVIAPEESPKTIVEKVQKIPTTATLNTSSKTRTESKKQVKPPKTTQTITNQSKKKTGTQAKVSRTKVETKTKTVTKTQVVTKPVEVDPTINYGLLTVSADDSAQVYVDGKKIRGVPLVDYRVSQGKHVIIVAQNLTERQRLEVTIEKGYSYIYVWSFFNNRWTRKEKSIISK